MRDEVNRDCDDDDADDEGDDRRNKGGSNGTKEVGLLVISFAQWGNDAMRLDDASKATVSNFSR